MLAGFARSRDTFSISSSRRDIGGSDFLRPIQVNRLLAAHLGNGHGLSCGK